MTWFPCIEQNEYEYEYEYHNINVCIDRPFRSIVFLAYYRTGEKE